MTNYQNIMNISTNLITDTYQISNIYMNKYSMLTDQYVIDYGKIEPWLDYASLVETTTDMYNSLNITGIYRQTLIDNQIKEENILLYISPIIFMVWLLYRFTKLFSKSNKEVVYTMSNNEDKHTIKKNRTFDTFTRTVKNIMNSNISNKDKVTSIERAMDELTWFFGDMKTKTVAPRRNVFRESRKRRRAMKNEWVDGEYERGYN
jgi:hypothetical protein